MAPHAIRIRSSTAGDTSSDQPISGGAIAGIIFAVLVVFGFLAWFVRHELLVKSRPKEKLMRQKKREEKAEQQAMAALMNLGSIEFAPMLPCLNQPWT
ncbi:hypothetical protein BU24DRAFT_462946 [Aaosphaeria arxii CBS 175.79]|uniref:Uncharacterized protein n=1 Tax=Aaosphaeria arxii CBS 175.79 TaxID=1450172 RepID=A0A6A5XLU5_9PLEO|nr:uncharacterized protein BU24DRAFT_462946 [Aaosphaeria arxii CBS 175.79]KAF2014132.1 hypothetical protein BU24DRAFT_462946 [Aaosphaeria arxii CBS 175.79]